MSVITSLLDNDLYKFTMLQAALHNFPEATGEYKLIVRSKGVDLRPYYKDIEREINHLCDLRFTKDELDYLESIPFFKKDFIDYLEDLKLKTKGFDLALSADRGCLKLRYSGSVIQKILFEVPLMAIISEVYLKDKTTKDQAYSIGLKKLDRKIEKIKELNSKDPSNKVKFADFGTRRRFSSDWHSSVVERLTDQLPSNFVGTSNLMLAKKYNLKPIGTMAHEWIQMGQGLGKTQLRNSQKYMFETWVKEYRGDLGIALTDTISSKAFLKDFDLYFSKLFDGCRHDSGCPYTWGDSIINHYLSYRIDPSTKTLVFSDGLDFDKMINLESYFKKRIKTSYGIGTNITNDVGVDPLSMVIKLVGVNGNPVAKISDEPAKAICEDEDFLKYLKKVFDNV